MPEEKEKVISAARSVRVRMSAVGTQLEALSDPLRAQLAQLDDDELAVLSEIKAKLNSGLDEKLKRAADTVGGFVW